MLTIILFTELLVLYNFQNFNFEYILSLPFTGHNWMKTGGIILTLVLLLLGMWWLLGTYDTASI